ncbi:hypothetical protein XH88_35140 [Bradyrhizobium sp. CCBAU 51627]|nr:hypothetical protein [Bradyrhizobium sp. CCBAU 51627]
MRTQRTHGNRGNFHPGLQFYGKNDQAFIEKSDAYPPNGALPSILVARSGPLAGRTLLFGALVREFGPSFKLIREASDGARIHKTYRAPQPTNISGRLPKQETTDVVHPASMKCMPAWIETP